jgi:DNA-binding FadR family transcriptional regulator
LDVSKIRFSGRDGNTKAALSSLASAGAVKLRSGEGGDVMKRVPPAQSFELRWTQFARETVKYWVKD